MGRKATGRSTKVVRIPNDCDYDVAMHLYYVVLPELIQRHAITDSSPRNYNLQKFLKLLMDSPVLSDYIGGDGKTYPD